MFVRLFGGLRQAQRQAQQSDQERHDPGDQALLQGHAGRGARAAACVALQQCLIAWVVAFLVRLLGLALGLA